MSLSSHLVRPGRLELPTPRLKVTYSTTELWAHFVLHKLKGQLRYAVDLFLLKDFDVPYNAFIKGYLAHTTKSGGALQPNLREKVFIIRLC